MINIFIKQFRFHWQAIRISAKRLWSLPLASTMTMTVIGIVLALPMGLFVLLQNVQYISEGWNQGTQISLYLKQNTSQDQIEMLIGVLRAKPEVSNIRYISPKEGLHEFEQHADLHGIINVLKENPLPPVIEIWPSHHIESTDQLKALITELGRKSQIDSIQLDMQWLQRLYALIGLAQHVIFLFALILAVAVFLIIGNTIRLATQNHRDEIEVIKLIGATDSFIRRPFLYTGIAYGLFGGLIAWVLVYIALWSLKKPVTYLATLYDSQFHIHQLSFVALLFLVMVGALLGLIGAFVAVNRELGAIQPS